MELLVFILLYFILFCVEDCISSRNVFSDKIYSRNFSAQYGMIQFLKRDKTEVYMCTCIGLSTGKENIGCTCRYDTVSSSLS